MANNNVDVELQAGLNLTASETQIINDIQVIQKRLDAAGIKISLSAELDKKISDVIDKAASSDIKNAGKSLGRQFSDSLIDQFGIVSKEVQRQIRELSQQLESINQLEILGGQQQPEFVDVVNQIGEAVERNANIIQAKSGVYDDFMQYFKSLSGIRIPQDVISELSNDWNYLRNSYASKFITDPDKSAIGLDSIYQEMSSKYPSIIPDTTDQVQMLKNIVSAIRAYRDDIDKIEPVDPEKITGFKEDMWDSILAGISNMRSQLQEQLQATTESTQEVTTESQAMESVGQSAESAATQKKKFANANKEVAESAETTADAVNDERGAMANMNDIDSILQNINFTTQRGTSVFQIFGVTLQRAFGYYTLANAFHRALTQVVNAAKEGVETVKELDASATNIQMVTQLDDSHIKALMQSYNALGKEIAATTSSVADSATEWYRQGKSVEDTNKLIEDSMVFSKIAGISSSDATKYLTSSMNGYNVAVDDVIGIVDKLNNVDQNAAVSAAGLAEAMSKTAKSAQLAGIDMDELLGIIAGISEVTQASASSVGTSIKSILARMSQIKSGKLQYIDPETGTEEILSDVETSLNNVGIKLRDSSSEFRDFGEVLEEVASKWKTMNSVTQGSVAQSLGGTRMQNNVRVLMENWDRVKELTEVSRNSDGVAMEKFDIYLDSIDAKTNALKASLEGLATSTISDDLYKSILDISKGMVDATTETGILKASLAGLGTSATIYGVQQLARLAASAAQEFTNLGEAINITKAGNVGTSELQRLVDLTGGLTQSQTRLLLSTNNLTDAQKIAILMNQGMSQAQAEAQIQTWGLATAENGAKNATITLGSAFQGLWSSLLANPLVLITAAVTAGVMAWQKWKRSQEEAAQKTREAAESANTLSNDLADLTKQYFELSAAVETDSSKRRDLMAVQEKLMEKLGLEGQSVDDLKDKYGSLSNAIQQATIDSLKAASIDLIAGVNQARSELEKVGKDNLLGTNNSLSATGESAVDAYKVLESAGLMKSGEYGTQGGIFTLYGDNSTVDGILENYNRLDDALKALRDSGKFTMEELSENPVYKQLYTRWDELKEAVNGYSDAIGNLNANMAQQKILESLQGVKELPDTEEEFNAYKQGLIESAQASDDFIGDEKAIAQAIENYLSTLPQFAEFYGKSLDELADKARSVSKSFPKEEMISAINGLSDGFEELDKIYKSISDQNPFDFSLLDDKKFKETFSGLGKSYTDFVEQVSSSPSDIDKCKESFNGLVTEWLNSTGIVSNITAETSNLTTAMLTNMGIENAEEIVAEALANNQARLAAERYYNANATDQLKDATVDEYAAFLNEADSADVSQMALAQLELAKLAVNNVKIDTASDIDQVISLANAAGASANALSQLARAKAIYAKAESTGLNGSAGDLKQLEEADSIMEKISNGNFDYEFTIDSSKFKSATYGGGNKSNKTSGSSGSGSGEKSKTTYDWIEQKIKYLTDQQSTYKQEVDDTNNSYKTQLGYLSEVVDLQKQIINGYKEADASYLQNYNEVSAGLPQEIKNKIEKGDWSVDYEKDETLKKAKEAWDKYYENHKKEIAAEQELQDLEKSGYDKRISWADSEISKLQDKMGMVYGYANKNSFEDAIITQYENQIKIYTEMVKTYQQKIVELGLSAELIQQIQNNTVDLSNLDEQTQLKVLYYQQWNKTVEDCSDSMTTLRKKIKDVNKQKIDNMISQFDILAESMQDCIDTHESLINLYDESGRKLASVSDYDDLISRQKKLTKQYAEDIDLLQEELDTLEEGSDAYNDTNKKLQEYYNKMIDCASAVEDYKDQIVELTYQVLDDYIDKLDMVNNTISTMTTLIGDEGLLDDNGGLTDRGLAQVALYAQQLSQAKQEAEEYRNAIVSLDEALAKDLITTAEYDSMLKEYRSAQESAVEAVKSAQDAILSLVKEGIQAEIDAKEELVDTTKAELEAQKDLDDYNSTVSDKLKQISVLEKQIATLSLSTNREDVAQKLELQEQLADLQKELVETTADENLDKQKEALDDELDKFTEVKEAEMTKLDTDLDAQEAAIADYLSQVQSNYSTVYTVLNQYGEAYNLEATEDLTTPWESGSDAADLCASAIGDAVSTINYEIANIDTSPIYDLIEAFNELADQIASFGGSSSSSSSSSSYENVTGQGTWQKSTKNGKWWYGETYRDDGDYWYADSGYYNINGKTYGFDDDGYMLTGWDDTYAEDGKWHYFDPDSGEMQKSVWQKGKDGNWYYLTKDGSMATDAAVKAKDGNGYYYVDDDGVWDGQTLTAQEVNDRHYKTAYKTGTKSAKDGIALWQENGLGSEIRVTKDGVLQQFDAGDRVFNDEQVDKLWKITQLPDLPFTLSDSIANPVNSNAIIKRDIGGNVENTVIVQGDASEKTISLINNALYDFAENKMAKEFMKQLKYELR